MDRVILKHGTDLEYHRAQAEPRGTWIRINLEENAGIVTTFCPDCGRAGKLGKAHTISENGEVNPSIVCTNKECTFHKHIKLEDWGKS